MKEGSESRSDSASPSLPAQSHFLKEFIQTYETCPSLWDPKNRNYLNKTLKTKELDKLVGIYKNIKPNATRDDVRRKVNSLRSNYRKELKKIEQSKRTARGADEVYKPKSSTFHLLKFLAKIDKPVSTREDSDHTLCEEDKSLVFSSMTNEEPPVKNNKIIREAAIAKENELINKTCNLLSQPAEPTQQNINPLIALVWSDKLKRLHPTQRLYAEKAINDILFEAELNNLNRNSVQINNFATRSSPAASTPYPLIPPPVIQVPENPSSEVTEPKIIPNV